MNPSTPRTEPPPSTQRWRAVFGDSLHACVVCLLFVFVLQATAMEPPHSLAEAQQLYDRGNAAFGAKKWQEALKYYGSVEQFLTKNPTFRNSFDHYYRGFSIMDTVQKRRALGVIRPEVTHRILVMFTKVDAPFPGGRVQAGFPPDLKATAESSQEACARMIEVLSAGRVSLEFTRMELDATVTELSASATLNNESDSVEVVQAVVESLVPYPAEIFHQNLDRYDTFLWYWDDKQLRTTRGGYATALGGAVLMPLVPGLLTGPERGRLIVSARLLSRPGTLLHELFHTFEKCYGISPIHGFRSSTRNYFPEWTGTGEFDYYRYHFNRVAETRGLAGFGFRKRFPSRVTADLLKQGLDFSRTLKPEELHGSETFTVKHRKEGMRLHGLGDYDKALAEFTRLYTINPFDAETCYWMGVESYRKNNCSAAIRYFNEGLALDPASARTLQYRGVVQYRQGNHNQAAADFRNAIAVDSRQAEVVRRFLEGQAKRGDAAAKGVIEAVGLRR
ncbi:MAG: tetratricopeptide repeat protein [Verrucomicrobiia bacterium]